jgi:penicillin amidase
VRKNRNGLLPVAGDGSAEWSGFLPASELPRAFNPPQHYIATANHNILPAGYRHALNYDWAQPFRFERVREMLGEKKKFTIADFERMQQDVTSLPARRFLALIRELRPQPGSRAAKVTERMRAWDGRLTVDSIEAMIFEVWIARLSPALYREEMGRRADLRMMLETLATRPSSEALLESLEAALTELENGLGSDMSQWTWGRVHQITFRHPLNKVEFHRGPVARPGDANTVNATSGPNFRQANGASYRQILDPGDWDRSVMTNVPGESGDPASPHYSDLLADWSAGKYHPLPYSRKAVEAAVVERMRLVPKAQ